MAQYIYTTNRLSKIVSPKRYILRDISLSFFPGAKIGILGLNGGGKSTLLRIMAGVDKEFDGEARKAPATVADKIREAASSGKQEELASLLSTAPASAIDTPDRGGWTALMHAVSGDKVPIVQLLLQHGERRVFPRQICCGNGGP